MKKICVYTCITGSYDDVKEFKEFKEKNIDYILFTNNKDYKSDFWNVVYIENDGLDNVRLNRKIKILGHEIINNNYDYSIYIDGSISLRKPISKFINDCCDFKKYDLIGFKHSTRDCIYTEGKACLKYMKEDKDKILKEMDYIKSNNYPSHNGLMENTVFARNLKSKEVMETCKKWFDMVLNFSPRDQLSFCYCAYQTRLNYKLLDMNVFDNEYFYSAPHKRNNQIDKYRFYFGDDTDVENMKYEYDIVGKYTKKNNSYYASVKSPCDTDLFKFTFGKYGAIRVNNIKINNKPIHCDNINGVIINNEYYYYSDFPSIIIRERVKKNQVINLSFDIKNIDKDQLDDLAYNLVHMISTERFEKSSLVVENRDLKNKLNELVHSKSWKITKPIRFLTRLIRKNK